MIYIKKEKLEEIIKHQNELIEDLQNELDSANSRSCDLAMRICKAIDKLYCYGETLNPQFQKEMLEILEKGKK